MTDKQRELLEQSLYWLEGLAPPDLAPGSKLAVLIASIKEELAA
jgi:hypothetical protein